MLSFKTSLVICIYTYMNDLVLIGDQYIQAVSVYYPVELNKERY